MPDISESTFVAIEQLRDIFTGRATYNNDEEWIDNLEAALKELCAASGQETAAFHTDS